MSTPAHGPATGLDLAALDAITDAVEALELRVADEAVGTLRMRARNVPRPALVKLVSTPVASEVERVRAPDRASEEALGAAAVLAPRMDAPGAEVVILLPGADDAAAARAADAVVRELHSALPGHTFALGRSRPATDPA